LNSFASIQACSSASTIAAGLVTMVAVAFAMLF
jgi:hypothetical protein